MIQGTNRLKSKVMKMIRIAVLMTVFNRMETTIKCLKNIISQSRKMNAVMHIYLVDDGTDGTGAESLKHFPKHVKMIRGNGHLFWCGGMRLAFASAIMGQHEYYLWLNDDTMLYENGLSTLIDTSNFVKNRFKRECIVVGSLQDPESKKLTYGGMDIKIKTWKPLKAAMMEPRSSPIRCTVFNGNCVLIPDEIANAVGNLSSAYIHAAADYDYGLKAKKKGYESWIAPGYIGACARNETVDDLINLDQKSSKKEIVNLRIYDWITFALEYGGAWKIPYKAFGKLRLYFPKLWALIIKTKNCFFDN